jgi:hypothetical protein
MGRPAWSWPQARACSTAARVAFLAAGVTRSAPRQPEPGALVGHATDLG